MTDKEFKIQKKRVETILKKWRSILNLHGHRIHRYYERGYKDGHQEAVANIIPNWEYMNHTITIYLPKVQDIDSEDELTELLVHELVHILIDPAVSRSDQESETQKEKIEFATQSIAYALIWAYEAGQHDKSA